MRSHFTNKLLLVGGLLLFALSASAQSITFTTAKKTGEMVTLEVRANGTVTVEGIDGKFYTDGDSHDYKLTNSTVKISGDITKFDCTNNKITGLLASGNSLQTIYCLNNEISSLDISQCSNLERPFSHGNKLEQLDVTANKQLKVLTCSDNLLSTLDISNNLLLNRVVCDRNKLTALDLSKNTKLNTISCIDNQLTSLDVSSCPALKTLNCMGNRLTTIGLADNNVLQELGCSVNCIKAEGMTSLIAALPTVQGGNIFVINLKDPKEENVCTKTNVAKARAKGWQVYDSNYKVYEGSADKVEPQLTFTTTTAIGGEVDLLIVANGPVTATGLEGAITPGGKKSYKLTAQTVTLKGDITEFSCTSNNLSALDLSNCTNLQVLDCDNNDLTTLDLSKNSKIENVRCTKNNLTSLNLSQCNTLIRLTCYKNELTALDLSSCKNLGFLYCQENELTALDLSSCPYLMQLYCYSNKLESLNVSKCMALQALLCYRNNLTSLDLSQCESIKNVYCQSNSLTDLDVSNCFGIQELNCSENKLSQLTISPSSMLNYLSCQKNLLNCSATAAIVEGLPQMTAEKKGSFVVLSESELNSDENNIIYKDAVEKAQNKNWLVTYMSATYEYLPYAGREGSCGGGATDKNKISFTTEKAVGETISLAVKSGGEVVATGIKEKIVADGKNQTYTLTAQTVTLQGDAEVFKCNYNALTSLEFFGTDMLKEISCSGNKLTTLDVKGCPNLENLTCATNKITALDLSACKKLIKVLCHANQLTELNLSACPSLQFVWCQRNQIASLDLSNCTNLQKLKCGDNKLSTLDITSCEALTDLFCEGNQLTKLDVSNSTKLLHLWCSANMLTDLNISGCESLTQVYCYTNKLVSIKASQCPKLTHLWCSNNELTTLDLSQCPSLKQLYCYDNKLTAIDLSKCPNLISLECYKNQIKTLDFSKCPQICFVYCEDNRIGCTQMEAIVTSLPQRQLDDDATFIAVTANEDQNPNTGNVITKHVAGMAKSKNWAVFSVVNAGDDEVTPYEGRDGKCTDNALSFAVTVSENANGRVTVKGAANLEAVPYGTELTVEVAPEAGYELDKLMANDEDITATKRFVVKSNVKVTATFKTGAESVAREGIALYPNPASSEANLFGVAPQSEVSIYGTDGARLLTVTADQSGHAVLRLEGLTEGNYLVTFRDAMGELTTRQLTIKR